MYEPRRTLEQGVWILSIGAILLTGCSEASRQRWNDFWGLNDANRKPVVRGTHPDRSDEPAREMETARSKPTSFERIDPSMEVNLDRGDPQAIDRYADSMTPGRVEEYHIYDHMDKVRRQQDPDRQLRIERAAANIVEDDPIGRDMPGENVGPSPSRTGSIDVAPPTGLSSPVRVASTEKRSERPIPMESAPKMPRTDAATDAIKSPAEPERHEANPAVLSEPPESGTAESAVTPTKTAQPPNQDKESSEPPVLTKIEITPVPKPEHPAKVESQKTSPERSSETLSNTTPVKLDPPDTFALRLKEQEARAAKSPNDIETQYRLRMMYLIDGRDDKALAPIEGINADVQEIIQAQIKALIAARSSAGRDSAEWANRQLTSIEELRRRVRSRADLSVPTVVLCTAIDGFGLYDPIDPPEFPAGRDNRVIVYIEVDNFLSRKTDSGRYRTLLSVRQSLLTAAGEEIWGSRDENIEDLSRQQRHDFYLSIGPITIPRSLSPGRYTLKVEVEDVLASKINSGRAEFKIVP
ncbi:MAG: hypothetical protein ACE5EQ_10910 [Phycisphaerae bacterium]